MSPVDINKRKIAANFGGVKNFYKSPGRCGGPKCRIIIPGKNIVSLRFENKEFYFTSSGTHLDGLVLYLVDFGLFILLLNVMSLRIFFFLLDFYRIFIFI